MTIMKYEGGISYEGLVSGSRAKRFWLLDTETVLLDLVSKATGEDQPATRFLGVAEKRRGEFVTPWVYLMNPDDGTYMDGSASIAFCIGTHDDEILRVTGVWSAEDEKTCFKFDCNLRRVL